MKRNGHTKDQLTLPGFFTFTRLPNGDAQVRLEELPDEVSVAKACRLLHLGRTYVNWLCQIGALEWRWASPLRGKRLISSASIVKYRAERKADAEADLAGLPAAAK